MKESSAYQAILAEGMAEGIEKGLTEGREKGLTEGREKGKAEGKAEGLTEGRAEEARNLILRLGAKRFGDPDAETRRQLAEIVETEQLERLAERLFEAETWDEFWN